MAAKAERANGSSRRAKFARSARSQGIARQSVGIEMVRFPSLPRAKARSRTKAKVKAGVARMLPRSLPVTAPTARSQDIKQQTAERSRMVS